MLRLIFYSQGFLIMKSYISKAMLLSAVTLVAVPAMAATTVFDFANLKYNANTFSGFLPTDGVACSGGDLCSSNINSVLGGDLTFENGGITVHASASYNGGAFGVGAAVVQDHENAYNGKLAGADAIGAGLGVYHKKNDNSDDNITTGEAIKLHFDTVVTLNAVGLRSDGHNTTQWAKNSTYQYSYDNVNWITAPLPLKVGQVTLSHTGQDFYFRFGGGKPDQFYLSSVTVTAVPEPETFAMLLAGLGVVGAYGRRRSRKD